MGKFLDYIIVGAAAVFASELAVAQFPTSPMVAKYGGAAVGAWLAGKAVFNPKEAAKS